MILSASAEVWRNRRVDVPESRSLSSRMASLHAAPCEPTAKVIGQAGEPSARGGESSAGRRETNEAYFGSGDRRLTTTRLSLTKSLGLPPILWKKRLFTSMARLSRVFEHMSLIYVGPIASSLAPGCAFLQVQPSSP